MIEVETEEELKPNSFYFFVNTKSGNQKGRQIMNIKNHNFNLYLHLRQDIQFNFVDLFQQNQKDEGIKRLKNAIEQNKTFIKVIICGGDGTVNWVLNDFAKNNIDMTKVVFGLLPIGTGNDLCRSLGWQVDDINYNTEFITKRINQWLKATQSKYDIWDVTIQAYNNGQIHDVRDKTEYVQRQKRMKKIFVNYVGMGLDGRVVYTMQKYRTSSAALNKILYGLVGCFNNFCRPMKELKRKIHQFTQYIESFNSQSNLLLKNVETMTNQHIAIDQQLRTENIMASLSSSAAHRMNHSFKKGFKGMVFLNCTSYMCGLRNVWNTSSLAVKQDLIKPLFLPQQFSDGKIQVVAYKSQFRLALQRIMRGGSRVTQGNGPFEIMFNQFQEQTTYIQIDGQSLIVYNLKSIRICKTSQIANHQISFMIKPQQP